jgi:ABC-type cobalamin/Fe3+-siderophores transport system ATPase subunit
MFLERSERDLVKEAMQRCGIEQFGEHDIRFLSGESGAAFIAMTLAQDTESSP